MEFFIVDKSRNLHILLNILNFEIKKKIKDFKLNISPKNVTLFMKY